MDRVEKLTIRRTLSATVVKLVVTEDGITIDYSVKTWEATIPDNIALARRKCDEYLKLAKESK